VSSSKRVPDYSVSGNRCQAASARKYLRAVLDWRSLSAYMDLFFQYVEQTALSVWLRESESFLAFPAVLILHTVGMAFLFGTSVAISLRILGFGRTIPIASIARFTPVLWSGFWINVLSGMGLLIAFPTKALTNWVFYVKLAFILLAVLSIWATNNQILSDPAVDKKPMSLNGKILAVFSLVCWVGAVITGRLLAYTYVRILSG